MGCRDTCDTCADDNNIDVHVPFQTWKSPNRRAINPERNISHPWLFAANAWFSRALKIFFGVAGRAIFSLNFAHDFAFILSIGLLHTVRGGKTKPKDKLMLWTIFIILIVLWLLG